MTPLSLHAISATGGMFPPTAWSRVAAAGETETARAAMSEVCGRYWQPARKFLRWLGAGEQDAEEMVQEFFAKWGTPENLARLDPDKGRLRSYLKQSLRRFFVNARRRVSVPPPEPPRV